MAKKLPFWHLTTNPNFRLDPSYCPVSAYGMCRPVAKPGLFVTDRPIYWSPWMGPGPIYAVRVDVPKEVLPRHSESHPEYLIHDLDRIKVREVLPLADVIERGEEEKRRGLNWWDQVYGGFGSVADWWYYYDEAKDEKVLRKGLGKLMEKWKAEHPGFRDPSEYYR